MSCRRASEIDPAEFLLEPRSSAFDDFRAHYPLCEECSRSVAGWNRMEVGLLALGEGAHPAPEQLAMVHAARSGGPTLPAAERARLDEHLSGCASCRDELRALRGFSPAALDAAPGAAATEPPSRGAAASSRPWWRRLAWSPALALGLVAVFLLPFLGRTPDEVTSSVPEIANRQDDARELALEFDAVENEAAPMSEETVTESASPAAPQAIAPTTPPSGVAEVQEDLVAQAPALSADSPAPGPAESALRSEAPAPGRARSVAKAAAPPGQAAFPLASPGSSLGLEQARAVRAFQVPLPDDWGRGGARVQLEPEARAERDSAKRSGKDDAGTSANLEAFAQGSRVLERRLGASDTTQMAETTEVLRSVPIAGSGFAGPGRYRVEVHSLDRPELPPRVYWVEVR